MTGAAGMFRSELSSRDQIGIGARSVYAPADRGHWPTGARAFLPPDTAPAMNARGLGVGAVLPGAPMMNRDVKGITNKP